MKKKYIALIMIVMAACFGTLALPSPAAKPAADTTVSVEYLQQIEQQNQRMSDSIRMLSIERQLAEYVEKKADRNLNLHMGLFGALMTLITCVVGVAVPLIINRSQRKKLDETAEKSEKAFAEAKKSANEAKALTFFMQALKEDDLDRQIELYTWAIEIIPDDADAYINRGTVYDNKGEYDKAIADYTKAIEISPNDAEAYNDRGSAYGNMGELDKAIKDFDKAIEINPDYAKAYYNRGNAYYNKGDYDKAIKDYDKAIAITPNDADAYYNRGSAYGKKGEYDNAIADFDKAIDITPDHALAYNNRGNAYYNMGVYDKAIKDYDKAIEINPDYAKAYYNRGYAYDDMGEYDKAIKDFNKAIEKKNDYAEAYFNRGRAAGKAAEKLEAEKKAEDALELYKAAVKDCDEFLKLWTKDDKNRKSAILRKQECEAAIKRLEGGDE